MYKSDHPQYLISLLRKKTTKQTTGYDFCRATKPTGCFLFFFPPNSKETVKYVKTIPDKARIILHKSCKILVCIRSTEEKKHFYTGNLSIVFPISKEKVEKNRLDFYYLFTRLLTRVW